MVVDPPLIGSGLPAAQSLLRVAEEHPGGGVVAAALAALGPGPLARSRPTERALARPEDLCGRRDLDRQRGAVLLLARLHRERRRRERLHRAFELEARAAGGRRLAPAVG